MQKIAPSIEKTRGKGKSDCVEMALRLKDIDDPQNDHRHVSHLWGLHPGSEIISGCVNLTGLLRVTVTKPCEESTVSKILELVENSSFIIERYRAATSDGPG